MGEHLVVDVVVPAVPEPDVVDVVVPDQVALIVNCWKAERTA